MMAHHFKIGDVVRFKCWNVPGSRTATIIALHPYNPPVSFGHASIKVQQFESDAPCSTDEISARIDDLALAL